MALTKKGRLRGNDEILKNLSKEINKIDGDLTTAFKVATSQILGWAKEKTPVEFGVLINTGFTSVANVGRKIVGRIGFTAKYAPYVHEMPMKNKGKLRASKTGDNKDRKGSFWEKGENKFLEKAVTQNTASIVRTIKRYAKR